MLFIKRSDCPPLLVTNQKQWTAPWIAHYRWQKDNSATPIQPTKPKDNYWLKDEIRLPLIDDFHNNCGYCGDSISTPENDTPQKKAIPKGDVEHFLPKAIYPEQVYEWTNYIWSCKECNQLKANKETQKSYNSNYLNPCHQDDCEKLIFNDDTGRYVLQDDFSDDAWWQERLRNSELKTMLNSEEICAKRRSAVCGLRGLFESITSYVNMISDYPPVANELQSKIDKNIIEISETMSRPDFYFLLQDQYQMLLLNYPKIAEVLKTRDLD